MGAAVDGCGDGERVMDRDAHMDRIVSGFVRYIVN
jgi:hypothetical protein